MARMAVWCLFSAFALAALGGCGRSGSSERVTLPPTPVLTIHSTWAVVKSPLLRVREGPSSQATVLSHIRMGAVMEVLTRADKEDTGGERIRLLVPHRLPWVSRAGCSGPISSCSNRVPKRTSSHPRFSDLITRLRNCLMADPACLRRADRRCAWLFRARPFRFFCSRSVSRRRATASRSPDGLSRFGWATWKST